MERIKYKTLLVYGIVYFAILLIYCSVNEPIPTGEWDDYSLPVASVLHDYNFGITDGDIEKHKEIFPQWIDYIDNYSLSGYFTKNGTGEMTWYFPIYSLVCIPGVLLLQLFKLPTIYSFPYTNIACLFIALWVVGKYLKAELRKKFSLILLLSINPIIFYISWTSAEVFIYSLLILALTFWYNRWYRRAAVCVSIAGMLNPTIMSIGIIMIVEYLFRLAKQRETTWRNYVREKFLDVIGYGCCYIVGLIPMMYNLYNVGHINLTASVGSFTKGTETIFERFKAYLFDLNYGVLPYFCFIFGIAVLLVIVGIVKRHWRFLEWIFCFLVNVLLYSIMTHINCGMSGIARYNAWGVVILLFATCMFYDEIISSQTIQDIVRGVVGVNILFTGGIIFVYGPNMASNTLYTQMTPIAMMVLDEFPSLYNPLHSTFYSRIVHVDGGYNYLNEMPIAYVAEDGYVRKVLASADDKEELLMIYSSECGYSEWWEDKVNSLTEEEQYISIPEEYKIVKAPMYKLGETMAFCSSINNGRGYVVKGLNNAEEWGSWTEGEEFELCFRIQSNCEIIRAEIDCGVFNNEQKIEVFVNDVSVYKEDSFKGGIIAFNFNNPGYMDVVDIKIKIPNAISPTELGYADKRILGIGISEIVFFDALERVEYQLGDVIYFDSNNNADRYIIDGINAAEEWGSWTEGNEFEMQFSMKSDSKKIHADIYCGVFNEEQDVIVYINRQEVYRCDNFKGGVLQFDFNNPEDNELINLAIMLPNAISPADLGYEDTRILGLGISKMIFNEAE